MIDCDYSFQLPSSMKLISKPLFLSINKGNKNSQGPNTQEYYGKNINLVDTISDIQIMDMPSDPYDNTNAEQSFCGGYNEWGHVVNRVNRSILPDLKPFLFPEEIKNQADVIYNKMKYQVRRGKIRSQMLFFCVYCSHLELALEINPIQLGSQFSLTQGEVMRCDSLFSSLQTGYKPPSKNASPLGYLRDYVERMDLSSDIINDVLIMSNNILYKDHTLYQENPQTVAAGLLRYYTITNGITTEDPQKITHVTGRSIVTIDSMFRRICTIDNA